MKVYGKVFAIVNSKTLKIFNPLFVSNDNAVAKGMLSGLESKDLEIMELELIGPDEYELDR